MHSVIPDPSRSVNPLNWSPANKAWLVFMITALLHSEYLLWSAIVLHEPAAAGFMNLELVRTLMPALIGVTGLSWLLVLLMAGVRHWRPESVLHDYACNFYYGLSLCLFSYFIGTLNIATGMVMAGAPVLGFILFRTTPVLWALATAVLVQTLASVGAVRGWWPYAPVLQDTPDQGGDLHGFWLASLYLFAGPHLIVLTLLSWYALSGWRRREEAVRLLSLTDPLTRLANRRSIIARLEHERESSARTRHPLTVIMVDLDYFKQLNDVHGHAAGDRALLAAAHRLHSVLRRSDHLGRFGGEEFLLVLPGSDAEGARLLAEHCRQVLQAQPIELDNGKTITLTASFGVYCNADHWHDSPDTMLRRADEALYQAKEHGRNRVEIAHPSPGSSLLMPR